MIYPPTIPSEESSFAEEQRDNRIVAFVMSTAVVISLLLLYAH
jgi:hypothetical protein